MKSKINWAQGIGILLLSLLLVGALYIFTREEPKPKEQEKEETASQQEAEEKEEPASKDEGESFIVTLRCPQSMADPYNDLKKGDTLYFLGGKQEMGEIVSLKLKDREIELKHEGEYILGIDPDDKLLEVKVKVIGKREPLKFTVDNVQLTVGQVIYPQTTIARVTATIWAIEKVEEEDK